MTKLPVIEANKPYTFADYFKLNADPEDVLSYFGCRYLTRMLDVPIRLFTLTPSLHSSFVIP